MTLFDRLGVATKPSDMSFSVSDEVTGVEWKGTSPSTVFAQRRNLGRPAFLRMLRDVGRFNRIARHLLGQPDDLSVTIADLLAAHRWSPQFTEWYLTPMGASIWSADPTTFFEMPAVTFARFFDNHGLLGPGNQPAWRTVVGGGRTYVEAILGPLGDRVRLATPVEKVTRSGDGVEIVTWRGVERFDHVIVATHSDQALAMLSDPSRQEREILGAFRYQPNRATLHTDERLLPRNHRAWASWNYHRVEPRPEMATLTYRLASLQGIDAGCELLVTLNRDDAVREDRVIDAFDYAHPVFDTAAIAAQGRYDEVSGVQRTWFCGAYWGYGFHEDGLQSAARVCRRLDGSTLSARASPAGSTKGPSPTAGSTRCPTGSPTASPCRTSISPSWTRSAPSIRCGRSSAPTSCPFVGRTSSTIPRCPSIPPCATSSRSVQAPGPEARSVCSPTCARGDGSSTRSASITATTPRGPCWRPRWQRCRTPRGTSAPPTCSPEVRDVTRWTRRSTSPRSSPWTPSTASGSAHRGLSCPWGWTTRGRAGRCSPHRCAWRSARRRGTPSDTWCGATRA